MAASIFQHKQWRSSDATAQDLLVTSRPFVNVFGGLLCPRVRAPATKRSIPNGGSSVGTGEHCQRGAGATGRAPGAGNFAPFGLTEFTSITTFLSLLRGYPVPKLLGRAAEKFRSRVSAPISLLPIVPFFSLQAFRDFGFRDFQVTEIVVRLGWDEKRKVLCRTRPGNDFQSRDFDFIISRLRHC